MRVLRGVLAAGVLAAAVTSAGLAAPGDALAPGGKPMFQDNPQHTGQSRYAGPRLPSLIARFDTRENGQARADIQSAIAVGADGTAYVTNFRGGLFALRAPTSGDQMQV